LAGVISMLAIEVSRQAQEDLRCLQAEVNAIINTKLKMMKSRHHQLEQHRKFIFPEHSRSSESQRNSQCYLSNGMVGHKKPLSLDAKHGGAQALYSQHRVQEKKKKEVNFSIHDVNGVGVALAECNDVHEVVLHNPPRQPNIDDKSAVASKSMDRALDQTKASFVQPGLPSQRKSGPHQQCHKPSYAKSSTFLQDVIVHSDSLRVTESPTHCVSTSAPDLPSIEWESRCNQFATQHNLPLCTDHESDTSADMDADDVEALAKTRHMLGVALNSGTENSLGELPAA